MAKSSFKRNHSNNAFYFGANASDGKSTNELEETKTTDYFMKNEKNNVSQNIICENTNVLEETNALKSFSCIICSKIFSSIDLLNIHKYYMSFF